MGSTWNSAFKAATITLSNGNLTAAASTAVAQATRSTTSKSAGKVFLEFTMSTVSTNCAVGFANSTETTAPGAGLGGDANSAGFYCVSPTQSFYANGSLVGTPGTTASSNGDIVSMAIDFGAQLVWVTDTVIRAGGFWNNVALLANSNPATGVGGWSFSAIGSGPFFAFFNDSTNPAATCRVNFGQTPFNQPIPSGFIPWDLIGPDIWAQPPSLPRLRTEMVPY